MANGSFNPAQVIARDRDDWDAKYDRALLYGEVNEPKKAVVAFDSILAKKPGDPEVSKPCHSYPTSQSSMACRLVDQW